MADLQYNRVDNNSFLQRKGMQNGMNYASMGMDFLGAMQQNNQSPYNAKWGGLDNSIIDNSIDQGIGMIPGWGQAAALGKKATEMLVNTQFDYNKFGQNKKAGTGADIARGVNSLVNPFSNIDYLKDKKKKTGDDRYSLIGQFTGKNNKLDEEWGGARESIDKDIEKKRKELTKGLNNINKQNSWFQQASSQSPFISGGMYSAKQGIVIKEHYEYTPISILKSEVKEKKPIQFKKDGGSIIPDGAFHETKNNIGDKGLAIVDDNGVKVIEIEKNELVLRREISDKIDSLRKEYKRIKDNKRKQEIKREIAVLMKKEIKENTHSYSKEYNCLNDNSCKI